MKKIMYLLPSLVVGGAEKIVKDYALNLDKTKFEVVIVTTSGSSNTVNEKIILDNNIKIYFIDDLIEYHQSTNLFRRLIARLKRYRIFRKIVNKESPDIIHSHLGVNDFLALVNVNKQKIMLIHSIHSEVSVSYGKGTHFHKWGTHYCVKNYTMKILTLHSRMKEEVKEMFGTDRSAVLNVPIDISFFAKPSVPSKITKNSLNISENSFVIGHIGSFRKPKNHTFLIDIFKKVKEYRENSTLVLAGIGELEKEIREKVQNLGLEDSVCFLGLRDDIPELLSIMDVLVFPSLYEGFPVTLLEAQSAGVKLIVSDTVTEEVKVTNLVNFLSLKSDPEIWAKEVLKPTPKSIVDYGLNSYDINHVISKLEKIYSDKS